MRSTNEVRVVRVDVGQLALEKLVDHVLGGCEALLQDLGGDHVDLVLEQHEPAQLLVVQLRRNALQLHLHQLRTLQRRLAQQHDLPPHQHLERALRHEQRRTRPSSVADGGAVFVDGDAGRGADGGELLAEHFVEDVPDARAAVQARRGHRRPVALHYVLEVQAELVQHLQQQPFLVSDSATRRLAQIHELPLRSLQLSVYVCLDPGQLLTDVLVQQLIASLGQILGAALVCNGRVGRVAVEELALVPKAARDGLVLENVTLSPVDHTDEAEVEGDDLAVEDVECVGAAVHEVELREHANGPGAHGVHRPRQLQRIGRGDVLVGRLHCKDDRVLGSNVVRDHIPDEALDVLGLVTDRHSRNARGVHQCQGQD
mmetsp:Transcript_16423/g.64088  ORF Transcript_16423/g.64088 Transcript_16423/m.64088 type:complete len:372 (+) Transcript_16423:567-1682(+)